MSRSRCAPVLVPLLLASFATTLPARPIEAVEGKRYSLSERHGPWMILVASFQDVPRERVEYVNGKARVVPNEDFVEGKSAYEAADELVYELRRHRIPAYTFEQKAEYDHTRTIDRQRRRRTRTFTARKRSIAVLAGNYKSAKHEDAQQTLRLLKRFRPECLAAGPRTGDAFTTHSASGAVFHPTPGQPTPLSGAFLTMNPLLTPEQARRMGGTRNKLLARLNSGNEYSLAKKQGTFTIQVATFEGRSTAHPFGARPNERFFESDGSSLDVAATKARRVATRMRQLGTEAYVHHEQFRSIVTVGSFDSPDDPRIERVLEVFSPKPRKHPKTGEMIIQPEFLAIPPARKGEYGETIPMDPQPRVIRVPRF